MRGGEQQRIDSLDDSELRDPTGRDRKLVAVEHHVGRQHGHQPVQRLCLGQ